jgi:hypothetical protein
MRPLTSSLALLLLSACSGKWSPVDVDGDGFTVADGDCWDNASGPLDGISSADVNPGATAPSPTPAPMAVKIHSVR